MMAVTRTIIEDNEQYTIFEDLDPSIGYVGRDMVWKAGTRAYNRAQVTQRAQQALTANASYLLISSPTNAQIRDQVNLLTRECSGLIRLLLDELNSTGGT